MGVSPCGFKSRSRHQEDWNQGDVAKWSKAEVCKTSIRRFESARRLQIKDLSALELKGLAEVAEW